MSKPRQAHRSPKFRYVHSRGIFWHHENAEALDLLTEAELEKLGVERLPEQPQKFKDWRKRHRLAR